VAEAAVSAAALHAQAAALAATAATFVLDQEGGAAAATLPALKLVPVLEPTGKAAGTPGSASTQQHFRRRA
jgi:hypothetical protein